MSKTVIIGGVAGGAGTAARLRRLDEKMEIVLIERGDNVSYANCGLPYFVGGVIAKRGALLLQTPELLRSRYAIDVRIREEVIGIFRKEHEVLIRRQDGSEYRESYDDLVIATGSSPYRPQIPGADLPGIHTLWTVKDSEVLRAKTQERAGSQALVVGGGFIGLEAAENLCRAGMEVTVLEALPKILPPFDPEMTKPLEKAMRQHGIRLLTGRRLERFEPAEQGLKAFLSDGTEIEADPVLLSVGVRPNNELALEASLAISDRGGIVTNEFQQTSDPDIYAAGDVTAVTDPLTGDVTMIPLAGPAGKQARIVADQIAKKRSGFEQEDHREASYPGTYGTSILKLFEMSAGCVGRNETALLKEGKKRGTDYEYVLIAQRSHAGYYPGSEPLYLKVLFTMQGKLLGAQCIGTEGVDKRIDVIATALQLGADVRSLARLELAYAPPFSSQKDPVNMAGFAAGNILDGLVRFRSPEYVMEHLSDEELLILDVREKAETEEWSVPGALNISLGTLRERMDEVREVLRRKDRSPEQCSIGVLCGVGVRAYNAARILSANGFPEVFVIEGGSAWYRMLSETVPEEH